MLDATVVDPGLCIITFDIVVSPSHEEAYLQTISEASFAALTNLHKYNGNRMMALTESVNLAMEGQCIDIGSESSVIIEDYCRYYGQKTKTIDQYYNFNEADKVTNVSNDGKFMTLQGADGTMKKVMSEDFIKKDIRHRIRNI
jgi:hypothetical protein